MSDIIEQNLELLANNIEQFNKISKALNTSRLVKKKVLVTRGGKTFAQTVYINPDEEPVSQTTRRGQTSGDGVKHGGFTTDLMEHPRVDQESRGGLGYMGNKRRTSSGDEHIEGRLRQVHNLDDADISKLLVSSYGRHLADDYYSANNTSEKERAIDSLVKTAKKERLFDRWEDDHMKHDEEMRSSKAQANEELDKRKAAKKETKQSAIPVNSKELLRELSDERLDLYIMGLEENKQSIEEEYKTAKGVKINNQSDRAKYESNNKRLNDALSERNSRKAAEKSSEVSTNTKINSALAAASSSTKWVPITDLVVKNKEQAKQIVKNFTDVSRTIGVHGGVEFQDSKKNGVAWYDTTEKRLYFANPVIAVYAKTKTASLKIKNLFATSPGLQHAMGMVSVFYGGSKIDFKEIGDSQSYELHNSKGKIEGVGVVKKGSRYHFGTVEQSGEKKTSGKDAFGFDSGKPGTQTKTVTTPASGSKGKTKEEWEAMDATKRRTYKLAPDGSYKHITHPDHKQTK